MQNKISHGRQKMIALVREVAPSLNRCALVFRKRSTIKLSDARTQHMRYCNTLKRLGVSVLRLPSLQTHPDSCFVEDSSVVIGDSVLICRMGTPERRGEEEAI